MSIEQKIEALTAAIEANTAAMLALAEARKSGTPASQGTDVKDNDVKAEKAEKADAKAEKADAKAEKAEKAAAKKAAAEKAAAEKAAAEKEDDGLDGDDGLDAGGKEYTLAEMKDALIAVKDAAGDKAAALNILREFGYTGIPSVQEKDATKIAEAAIKALRELQG